MPKQYACLAQVTVGAGGAANITFNSIPSTYTDLCVKVSTRSSSNNDRRILFIRFNGATSGYDDKTVRGYNGGVASQSNGGGNSIAIYDMPAATATASTFGSIEFYIPNYTGSTNKAVSADGAGETNGPLAVTAITAGSSNITSAISSIDLFTDGTGVFVQHSTATLYGITKS